MKPTANQIKESLAYFTTRLSDVNAALPSYRPDLVTLAMLGFYNGHIAKTNTILSAKDFVEYQRAEMNWLAALHPSMALTQSQRVKVMSHATTVDDILGDAVIGLYQSDLSNAIVKSGGRFGDYDLKLDTPTLADPYANPTEDNAFSNDPDLSLDVKTSDTSSAPSALAIGGVAAFVGLLFLRRK